MFTGFAALAGTNIWPAEASHSGNEGSKGEALSLRSKLARA